MLSSRTSMVVQIFAEAMAEAVAAGDVSMVRQRTGLIPAHAVQLLVLSNGSVDDAIELYQQDPNMFNVSQAALFPHDDAQQDAAARGDLRAAPPAAVPAVARSHVRSQSAKAQRNKLKKQRKLLKTLQGHAPLQASDGDAPAAEVGGHHRRLARAEAVGFARGVAAEKAAAKERRGAKRISKKQKLADKQSGRRMARRRRAGLA